MFFQDLISARPGSSGTPRSYSGVHKTDHVIDVSVFLEGMIAYSPQRHGGHSGAFLFCPSGDDDGQKNHCHPERGSVQHGSLWPKKSYTPCPIGRMVFVCRPQPANEKAMSSPCTLWLCGKDRFSRLILGDRPKIRSPSC